MFWAFSNEHIYMNETDMSLRKKRDEKRQKAEAEVVENRRKMERLMNEDYRLRARTGKGIIP